MDRCASQISGVTAQKHRDGYDPKMRPLPPLSDAAEKASRQLEAGLGIDKIETMDKFFEEVSPFASACVIRRATQQAYHAFWCVVLTETPRMTLRFPARGDKLDLEWMKASAACEVKGKFVLGTVFPACFAEDANGVKAVVWRQKDETRSVK